MFLVSFICLLTSYVSLDLAAYRREEGFILAGESGEPEALRPSEGDSSGSSATFEDASETLLAAEATGARDGDGAEGIPGDSEQTGL